MKRIKKLSLLLAVVLTVLFTFSLTAFANEDKKEIKENDKIYTVIPMEYELSVFSNNLSYGDDEGNTLTFCVGENKYASEGITSLKDWQIEAVFEHFYLYDGDLERADECSVKYELTEKRKANGYSCYYLQGNYAYSEEELNGDFAYYFNACVFATKEDIFVVGYEDINGNLENYGDLMVAINEIVLNGTNLNDDKPEKNANHNFSNSPAFEDAVLSAQEETISTVFEEGNIDGILSGVMISIFIAPTVILIVIGIVLITKYIKNKNKLKQYELTYGGIPVPAYNPYPQNYGGYGYNPPINQPYQPTVNPVYQQNPVNQNTQQTPSYVTNAVENLEKTQPTQPAQTNLPPEMQENKIDNENNL